MASLTVFAGRIRRRGKMVEIGADRAVQQAAVIIDQALVLATPVDTGRARANWQVGIDKPITEPIDETDVSGQTTLDKNNVIIRGRKSGQSIHITNNVDYIEQLNQGSSSQAPANFVGLAVQEAVSFLRRQKILR